MSTLSTYVAPGPPAVSVAGASGRLPQRIGDPRQAACDRRASVERLDGRRKQAAIRIAQSRGELYGAFRLVQEAYLRSDLVGPNRFGMRVTPYHLLPTTEVFVAVERNRVICTMSLVRDGRLGIPMEAIYDQEVGWCRSQGISIAEVSCLADRHEGSEHSFPTLLRLMSFTAQAAKRRGVDALLIAVHPRHAKFYERFLAFEPIGDERTYPMVQGNPAVALALDLNRLQVDHPRAYKRLFGVPFPRELMTYRTISDELWWEISLVVEACGDPETSRESMELATC